MNGNFDAYRYMQNRFYGQVLASSACAPQLQTIYQTYRLFNASNFYEYCDSFYALYNAAVYRPPVFYAPVRIR